MIAQVIQAGKATLRELRENYSLHDLYCIWDVVREDAYNRWMAYKDAEKKTKVRR